jgi:hypothetical protein
VRLSTSTVVHRTTDPAERRHRAVRPSDGHPGSTPGHTSAPRPSPQTRDGRSGTPQVGPALEERAEAVVAGGGHGAAGHGAGVRCRDSRPVGLWRCPGARGRLRPRGHPHTALGGRTSFNPHETGCRLIMGLTFEWDPAKAEANESKHGVSFVEAATIFRDSLRDWWMIPSIRKTSRATYCSASRRAVDFWSSCIPSGRGGSG